MDWDEEVKLMMEGEELWYVVPNYQDKGRSASVVNSKGEQVAEFESIDEANYVVSLVNSQSPLT